MQSTKSPNLELLSYVWEKRISSTPTTPWWATGNRFYAWLAEDITYLSITYTLFCEKVLFKKLRERDQTIEEYRKRLRKRPTYLWKKGNTGSPLFLLTLSYYLYHRVICNKVLLYKKQYFTELTLTKANCTNDVNIWTHVFFSKLTICVKQTHMRLRQDLLSLESISFFVLESDVHLSLSYAIYISQFICSYL